MHLRFSTLERKFNDTLKICYDLSGKQRPAEFKSLPGTRLYLVTYQRATE